MPCKSPAAKKMPCLGLDGRCYGPGHWDGKREYRKQEIRHMGSCPWVEKAREWWKKDKEKRGARP